MGRFSSSTPEQRAHRRFDVCVPVEVRVLDGRDGAAISDASHAVMRDVSAGGARLDVLQSAAGALADFKNGVGYLQLRLVTPELAHKEPIDCRIRWSRSMPGGVGWAVGIQFGDEEGGPCHWLVGALERHRTGSGRMSTPARVLLAAALALAMASGLYSLGPWSAGGGRTNWENRAERLEQQTEEAQHEIESLLERVDRSSESVTALKEQLQSCRDDLNRQPVELGTPPAPVATRDRGALATTPERMESEAEGGAPSP